MRRRTMVAWVVAILLCSIAAPAVADQPPYWPSEQETRLEELDAELLDTQQKLFTARQENNTEATTELTKAFKECQEKRLTLLRAMGHLPKQGD